MSYYSCKSNKSLSLYKISAVFHQALVSIKDKKHYDPLSKINKVQ